ncbi:DUF1800 domain-containing protein [Dyadobacter tibetensis]|uniref:DUF1800 domain-containing protein n=1 Tax=Dyadobacter tibetensis TaxID=1211851 RepID=UPI00046F2CF6|nr:DUF1800 domain-containing protein [Dyadobacter tibetensis]
MESKKYWRELLLTSCLFISIFLVSTGSSSVRANWKMPYERAGFSKKAAAALLLNRFTFGPRPGQVEEIQELGLENWFESQLISTVDDQLHSRLEDFDILAMSNEQIAEKFPNPGAVLREAISKGVIPNDSLQKGSIAYQQALSDYMREQGLRRPIELQKQLVSQKIIRAAYSKYQLQEVMTSFWFNHFNVSMTNNRSALFIPSFERDVIRPHALGNFNDLLLQTAKSPAMLYYLDNFSSASDSNTISRRQASVKEGSRKEMDMKIKLKRKVNGLNENYARELMELHTMGVDGGFTQLDVTEAARVLTGWTVRPMGRFVNTQASSRRKQGGKVNGHGTVMDGDFVFTPARHDQGSKVVLGVNFPENSGYEEGVALIELLAAHRATANFISRKIAIRFVSDNPSAELVGKMATVFVKEKGDIPSVLRAMVQTEEFWEEIKAGEKIKSPFELAIGSVRNLDADLTQPYALYGWISRMGEKMYSYQAPTGFPDNGNFWINTGSLLNRMNFGLAMASGRLPGVRVNLLGLNKGHEPGSSKEALQIYSELLLPSRDLSATLQRLAPLLTDPTLGEKLEHASKQHNLPGDNPRDESYNKLQNDKKSQRGSNSTTLAQVVGLILGSPEYQKR